MTKNGTSPILAFCRRRRCDPSSEVKVKVAQLRSLVHKYYGYLPPGVDAVTHLSHFLIFCLNFYGLAAKTGSIALQNFFFLGGFSEKSWFSGVEILFSRFIAKN